MNATLQQMGPPPSFAADLSEMMTGWDKIHAAVKAQFPSASQELHFQMTSSTFRAALGWGAPVKPQQTSMAPWAKE